MSGQEAWGTLLQRSPVFGSGLPEGHQSTMRLGSLPFYLRSFENMATEGSFFQSDIIGGRRKSKDPPLLPRL